jgi:hypothetical protein
LSDRLAKSFDRFLHTAIGTDSAARRRLMKLGWKEFIDTEHPETDSPAEMAAAAVIYLGVNNHCWSHEPCLIIAALGFLREHCGHDPGTDIQILSNNLKAHPVNEEEVHRWFREAFPEIPF